MRRQLTVSVIIPTYNRVNYLKNTINSLLNQTNMPYEIIVIDDGSTDGTKEYLEEISQKYKIIKCFYQKNSGPAKARNLGIKKARGNIIAFLDDDEIAHKNWIKVIVETFKKFDNIGGVGGPYIEERSKNIYEKYLKLQFNITNSKNFKKLPYLGGNTAFCKKVLQEIGGFDEKLIRGEDVDLSFRIRLKGYKIIYNKDMIIYHFNNCKNCIDLIKKGYNLGYSLIFLNKKYPKYFKPMYRILLQIIFIFLGLCKIPKNIFKSVKYRDFFYISEPYINLIYRSSIIIGICVCFLKNNTLDIPTVYSGKISPYKEDIILGKIKEKITMTLSQLLRFRTDRKNV